MKKVFVSIPMAGRTESEIYADMEKAMTEYNEKNPGELILYVHNIDHYRPKIPPVAYLGNTIFKMANCDDVIFAGDWENARRCKVERLVYDLYFKNES